MNSLTDLTGKWKALDAASRDAARPGARPGVPACKLAEGRR
jgi:hypothetical protein